MSLPLAWLPQDWTGAPKITLGLAGQALSAAVGMYLALFGIGKLLKYRLRTRLGPIYQLFSIVLAAYLANYLFKVGLPIARELGAGSSILGMGVLVRLVDQHFWRWYFEERRKAPIPKFIREVSALLVFVITVVLVLQFGYGVRVPGLLAASGVVGIILGFALQDSIGNIIGGFALQFGRPFTVGDWLYVDSQHVQAVEINWRSSRFITNDSVQLDVPNLQIIRQTIINYHGGGSLHAMRFEIGVDYDLPPNRVKDVLSRAAASAAGVLSEPYPNVFLKSYGDSAIVYEVRFWLDDHRLYNAASDAVKTNIWYALRRQRMKIPFPIRTLQVERIKPTPQPLDPARSTLRDMIANQFIFQGMRPDHLQALLERSVNHHYGRSETIIHEGADGASMFVLISGEAAVNVMVDGQQTRVASLQDGDCFGEMSLLTGEKRSASVVAVSDCEVMEITKRTFKEFIEADRGMLDRLSELLAQRQMTNDGIVAARAQESAGDARKDEYREGFLSRLRTFFEL